LKTPAEEGKIQEIVICKEEAPLFHVQDSCFHIKRFFYPNLQKMIQNYSKISTSAIHQIFLAIEGTLEPDLCF
jgi:hypothetical protein